MSNRTYLCHSCNRSNNYFQKYCGSCETPAAIACLRSTGKANLPIDFYLPLLPLEQSVGSGIHSDVLLPSLNVAEHLCDLNYAEGLFYFTSLGGKQDVSFNYTKIIKGQKYCLEHGCIINFGEEEFELIYFNKFNRSPKLQKPHLLKLARSCVSTSVSRQLQTIVFKNKLFECRTIRDVFSLSLDTALLMSGLERAYGFLYTVNAQQEIQAKGILAKNSDFKIIKDSDFTISQSIINDAIKDKNSIYISNSDIIKQKSESMFDFDIKTVICLPLIIKSQDSDKDLLGVLYLDKQFTSHQLPKKLATNLKFISSMASSAIHRLSKKNNTAPQELQTTIEHLKDELYKLKSHLKISADLINKYQYGNPTAIKTRIRECRKDLYRLSKIISGTAEVPTIQKLKD